MLLSAPEVASQRPRLSHENERVFEGVAACADIGGADQAQVFHEQVGQRVADRTENLVQSRFISDVVQRIVHIVGIVAGTAIQQVGPGPSVEKVRAINAI